MIARGEMVYASDEDHRVAFETRALDRYHDVLPLQREQDRARRERFRGSA